MVNELGLVFHGRKADMSVKWKVRWDQNKEPGRLENNYDVHNSVGLMLAEHRKERNEWFDAEVTLTLSLPGEEASKEAKSAGLKQEEDRGV